MRSDGPASSEAIPARGVMGVVEMGHAVFLRRPDDGDRDEFLAMVASSAALHGAWIRPPGSAQDFAGYLRWLRKRSHDGFVVCRLPDGAIAGVFNLVEISSVFKTAFCSYYAHAGFAGQGLMSEGLALVMRHAFGPLGLQALGASIQPGNAASIKLVQRAGFRPEAAPPRYLRLGGSWRGHPTWSITAERWRQLGWQAESGRGA